MARRPDVEYVQFYTDGSAARKLELVQPQFQPKPKPKHRHRKCRVIRIDPIALTGEILSVVLLLVMFSGIRQLKTARTELHQMESYVHVLSAENSAMQRTVRDSYDLEEVETQALALGMVPVEQVEHISFEDKLPIVPEKHTFWEQIQNFFAELLA